MIIVSLTRNVSFNTREDGKSRGKRFNKIKIIAFEGIGSSPE